MTCELHDFEKIIFAKRFKYAGEHGFIWWRCKKCGYKKPTMFPSDIDANGNPMSTNLERVKKAHPNYPIVWEEN